MKQVKVFDLKFNQKEINFFLKNSKNIFKEGFFSNHSYVKKFENQFKKINKSKFALSTSSGTSALEIILRSFDIKNKNVLVNSNTFIATGHAITNAGGKIVPVELEKNYFMMDPQDLKKKINKKTGAVVIVHIGGIISPNIFKIKKICKEFKVPLIEDAAQAHGSRYKNIYAGNFGDAGAISFFTTKVMTTGEGGMITTNNRKNFNKMYSLRQFGFMKNKLMHDQVSGNYKLSEFSALLGIIELKRLKSRIKKRNLIAKIYQKHLEKSKYKLLKSINPFYCNHYKQILFSRIGRGKIEKILNKNKISLTGGVYYIPLHRQPIYKKQLKKYKLPLTDYFCDNHFCPPCYPELDKQDIDRICAVLLTI
jgi:dTDP-4-amino-4,6-dideoxygalactose transaminase